MYIVAFLEHVLRKVFGLEATGIVAALPSFMDCWSAVAQARQKFNHAAIVTVLHELVLLLTVLHSDSTRL